MARYVITSAQMLALLPVLEFLSPALEAVGLGDASGIAATFAI